MKKLSLLLVTLLLTCGTFTYADGLPPDEAKAKEVLNKSPRHGEYVDIKLAGTDKPIRAYVVYPERKDKAPVVIVIHEIFGLSDWIRSVSDQLAADGFIAIAPDFLSGTGKDGGGTDSYADRGEVTKAVRGVTPDKVVKIIDAAREYGLKLPAATDKSATIGFCWGGGQSFTYAASQPGVNAAVIYYGSGVSADAMAKIKCPVMGNYGGRDARITATVAPTTASMKKLEKKYEPHVYDGAGHGFLRQQESNPANAKAANEAWPATIKFLKENTEAKK